MSKNTTKLSEKILAAQQGNKTAIEDLYLQFQPILRKYSYLLDDEDAHSELSLTFIEMIKRIPINSFSGNAIDYQILSYISRTIRNRYIALSKQYSNYIAHIIPLDETTPCSLFDVSMEDVSFFSHLQSLTPLQVKVVTLIYYYEFSSSEVAKLLGLSRQAVNQCKQRALLAIRQSISKN